MNVSPRDLRTLETVHKFQQKDLPGCLADFKSLLNVLLVLQDYVVKSKIRLAPHKVYIDTFITKFALHCFSLIYNLNGVKIQCKEIGLDAKIFDLPSLHVLVRAQMETLLMAEFIYFLPTSESELEFRYKNWIYAGLLRRRDIYNAGGPMVPQPCKDIADSDKKALADLKRYLIESPFFNRYSTRQQKEIINKGQERLFNSWESLMVQANINRKISSSLYTLTSSSAHSTGLSIILLKESKLGFNEKSRTANLFVNISTMLLATFIMELKKNLKAVEIKYNTLSVDVTDRIEIYAGMLAKKK